MIISELIKQLEQLINEHGDIGVEIEVEDGDSKRLSNTIYLEVETEYYGERYPKVVAVKCGN